LVAATVILLAVPRWRRLGFIFLLLLVLGSGLLVTVVRISRARKGAEAERRRNATAGDARPVESSDAEVRVAVVLAAGGQVQGKLLRYGSRCYRIRLSDDTVRDVPEAEVRVVHFLEEPPSAEEEKLTEEAGTPPPESVTPKVGKRLPRWHGKTDVHVVQDPEIPDDDPRASMEFRDTDVRAVLDLLARQTGKTLVMDSDVSGTVTIAFSNVPWRGALQTILDSAHLEAFYGENESIRIRRKRILEGPEVTLEVDNEHVMHALDLLAKQANRSLVIAKGVSGTVTLRLVNVPWWQALDTIMKATGLEASSSEDGVVRVQRSPAPEPEAGAADKGAAVKLELDNANLRALVDLLAQRTGGSYVIAEDRAGMVTARLANLAWWEALDAIVKAADSGAFRGEQTVSLSVGAQGEDGVVRIQASRPTPRKTGVPEPEEPTVPWEAAYLLESPHYLLKTNAPKATAKKRLAALEALWETFFNGLLKSPKYRPKGRLTVHLYGDQASFVKHAADGNPGVGSVYRPVADSKTGVQRIVSVFEGHESYSVDVALRHEGTHQLQDAACGSVDHMDFLLRPPWWLDGVALYMAEGHRLEQDGRLVRQVASDRHLMVKKAIEEDRELALADLVRTPLATFRIHHYAYAWALVDYLLHRGSVTIDGRALDLRAAYDQFQTFVLAHSGRPTVEGYAQSLDAALGIKIDRLTDDFRAYVLRDCRE
ncbi:hypothetical protein ACFL59_12765, partial [Planctomycetota bacterium]